MRTSPYYFYSQLSHQHEMLKPYLPYNIDHGIEIRDPMMNNLFYLSVWAIAHSTFARHSVKVYVTKILPRHLERPFYVFQASYLLHQGKSLTVLLFIYIVISCISRFLVIKNWAPMPEVIYEVPDNFKNIFVGLYIFGWLFVGFVSNAYAA